MRLLAEVLVKRKRIIITLKHERCRFAENTRKTTSSNEYLRNNKTKYLLKTNTFSPVYFKYTR